MNNWRLSYVFLPGLAALVASPGDAIAQVVASPPHHARIDDTKKKREGKRLREHAIGLYDAGKWADAFDAFKKAEDNFHSLKYFVYMARCKTKLGKLDDAYRLYRKVLDEHVVKPKPENYLNVAEYEGVLRHFDAQIDAKAEANEEIEQLKPTLDIVIKNPHQRWWNILIDDHDAPDANRKPFKIEPGVHKILIVMDGNQTQREVVTLTVGRGEVFPITLPPRDQSPRDQSPRDQSTRDQSTSPPLLLPPMSKAIPLFRPTTQRSGNLSWIPVVTVVSLGITSIVVGGGIYKYAEGLAQCNESVCPNMEKAQTLDSIGESLMVGGAIGAGFGFAVCLLLLSHPTRSGSARPSRTYVIPTVSPSGFFLMGTF